MGTVVIIPLLGVLYQGLFSIRAASMAFHGDPANVQGCFFGGSVCLIVALIIWGGALWVLGCCDAVILLYYL